MLSEFLYWFCFIFMFVIVLSIMADRSFFSSACYAFILSSNTDIMHIHVLVICQMGSAKKKERKTKKEVKFAHNSCDMSPLVFVCIKLLYICLCLFFS